MQFHHDSMYAHPQPIRWLIAAFCVVVIFPAIVCGQNTTNEYKVKVAYIYKIAHYVHAENTTGLTDAEQLVIGILGDDPFGPLLNKIAKERKIHSKPIVVKRFEDWSQYEECNLLFVSKTVAAGVVEEAIRNTRGKSVLLVGESEGFERIGGMFNMYLDSTGKVGLKLNSDVAQRQNLRVDARLMQVCDVVRDEATTGSADRR